MWCNAPACRYCVWCDLVYLCMFLNHLPFDSEHRTPIRERTWCVGRHATFGGRRMLALTELFHARQCGVPFPSRHTQADRKRGPLPDPAHARIAPWGKEPQKLTVVLLSCPAVGSAYRWRFWQTDPEPAALPQAISCAALLHTRRPAVCSHRAWNRSRGTTAEAAMRVKQKRYSVQTNCFLLLQNLLLITQSVF